MHTGTVAFFALALFAVHEFEEIVRVVPWIRRHANDPRLARDTWIRRRDAYPSTEVVAAEIGEEIVLVSLIMGLGIAADAPVVALAVASVNSLHLAGHLLLALRVRAWNPGSITAALTLPPNITLVASGLARGTDGATLAAAVVLLGVVLVANLLAMHRLAPAIHSSVG